MRAILCLIFVLLLGCEKYSLSVTQRKIDHLYLASSQARTPDPRQHGPFMGQMLLLEWFVPYEIVNENAKVRLHVIYWNYEEKVMTYPIEHRVGYATYRLMNEQYEKSKGILTYKADIVTEDGKVFKEWKHQLWTNLIHVADEDSPAASSMSDSVISQSMQGSVTDLSGK